MRYLESENPYIIVRFTTGDTVTIDIYDLSDNSKVVDGVSMTEIGSTGFFKYQFNPSPASLTEYMYVADNVTEEHAGKIILGGYPDSIKDETDKIQTVDDNVDSILTDTSTTLDNHLTDIKGTGFVKDTNSVVNIADTVWDEILTGATHNVSTSAGRRLRDIAGIAILTGTATAGTTTTITLDADASSSDHVYNRNLIVIIGGTGLGQTRTIAGYDGTSKLCSLDYDWVVTPDATSEYQLVASDTPLVTTHGTATAGTTTTITLASYSSSTDDIYLCHIVFIAAGTGQGQARLVGSYDGSSKIVTIAGDNWAISPDATSVYGLIPFGVSGVSDINEGALVQIRTEMEGAGTKLTSILTDTGTTIPATITILQTDITKVLQVEQGRWKIENNQMIFYDSDNTTPLLTFNLKNSSGNPTEHEVYERTPV